MRHLPFSILACLLLAGVAIAQTGFTLKTYPAAGTHLLTADFNHDGHTDLLDFGNAPAVRLNDTFGGFSSPLQVSSEPAAFAAVGDFNGDGFPDIATCTITSPSSTFPPAYAVNLYLNNSGAGTFSLATSIPISGSCEGIAVGDVNRDHRMDVVAGHLDSSGSHLTTWFGDGSGHLTSSVTEAVAMPDPNDSSMICSLNQLVGSDFKGNGNFDLLLFAYCENGVINSGDLYYAASAGNGQYSLTYVPVSIQSPNDIPRLTDVNHDGKADVVLSTYLQGPHSSDNSDLMLITNQGAASFSGQSVFNENTYAASFDNTVFSGDVADFSGDGIPDAAVAFTESPNPCCTPDTPGVAILNGSGSGTWSESQRFAISGYGVATVAGDFNNDNRNDFAVIAGGELQVFTNTRTFAVSSCKPDRAGVHLCSPAGGKTYSGAVPFTATASGINGPVRVMQIYVDGRKYGDFPGNQLKASLNLAAGSHTAHVNELEYNGQYTKSVSVTFTVASSCALPSTAGVHVCSPLAGSTVSSPVTFSAAARPSSGLTITAMRLYVNGVSKYTVNASTLYTTLSLAAGSYNLSFVAYESNGSALTAHESITVK